MKRKSKPKTLRADAARVLEACPTLSLRMLARRASAMMDARLRELSFSQFSLMVLIAAQKDDSFAALAERAGLDPSTLTRNLQTLERMEMVEVAMIEADLRRRAVWLTERGARTLERAIEEWRAGQAEVRLWLSANATLKDLMKES
jgi:DNA-binding MarR family transcriptional regulator